MVSIKDVVRSSVKVPEFDKHLKAEGHIGRNVEIAIKMKTIVQKTVMTKKKKKTTDSEIFRSWKHFNRISEVLFPIKSKILLNIVSVDLSTFPLILIIYTNTRVRLFYTRDENCIK